MMFFHSYSSARAFARTSNADSVPIRDIFSASCIDRKFLPDQAGLCNGILCTDRGTSLFRLSINTFAGHQLLLGIQRRDTGDVVGSLELGNRARLVVIAVSVQELSTHAVRDQPRRRA